MLGFVNPSLKLEIIREVIRRVQKNSKSLILFLSIGFLQGHSQSAQGFALQKSAGSRHENVSVDVFPRETVLQDPVER